LFSYGKMMVGGADSSAKLLLNVVFKADIPPTTLEYTFAEPNIAARWAFFSPPDRFCSRPSHLGGRHPCSLRLGLRL
jgi:hypothetical protein